jgi:hypothetical protein
VCCAFSSALLPFQSDENFWIANTNKTNPDVASMKGCSWDNTNRVITVERGNFQFGFLKEGRYYLISGNRPWFNLAADDSAGCGGLSKEGAGQLYFCNDLKIVETEFPAQTKFVQPPRR